MYSENAVPYNPTPKREDTPKHIEVAELMSREISNFPNNEVFEIVSAIKEKTRIILDSRLKNLEVQIQENKNDHERLQKMIASI